MKCEKCGLLLSVMDHIEAPEGIILRMTCNNPQCPNYRTVVMEIVTPKPEPDEDVEIATPGDEE